MAFSERYCDASASGSNLNGGFPIGGIYPVTETGGTFTQGGGAGGNDRFAAAAGTPFSACAVDDCVSVYADGGAAPTGYVGVITAINGGGASIDLHLTRFAGTRPTTGAGRTAKVGGPWKGPNVASAFPINFVTNVLTNAAGAPVRVNFKNGTSYSVFVASGATAIAASQTGPITWEGYTTTAGDGGLAVIDGTGGTAGVVFKLMVVTGTAQAWKHLQFNGNFAGSPTGGDANGNNMVDLTATNQYVFRCLFTNSWRQGLMVNGTGNASGTVVEECTAYHCNHDDAQVMGAFGAAEESTFINCLAIFSDLADDTDGIGFYFNGSAGEPIVAIGCISAFNADAGFRIAGATPVTLRNCVAWGNGGDGIETTSTAVGLLNITNCIIGENGGWGINVNSALNGASVSVRKNAFFSNTSGEITNINASFISGSVTLTGDPFTDATNGDFSLNNTAGAGAAARGEGLGNYLFDALFFSESTTSFPDIGAAQHEETAPPAGGQTSYTFG